MRLCLFLCLVLLGPRMATLRRPQKKKIQEVLPAATTASPGSRDFAFDLYRTLAAAAPDQNIFFSPLSISLSLAMLSLGARSNTKVQILEGLGIGPEEGSEEELHGASQRLLRELQQPQDSLQLSLGNALFTKPTLPIQEAFLGAMRTLYLADTFPTDFENPEGAKKKINDYVEKQTKGKIVDLIKSLDGTQVMVMVNYIFFKGKTLGLESELPLLVRVPMMKQQDQFYYLLDRNLSCKVVGVPYQGNATAFFILPREGEMEQVENGLKEKTLKKWLRMPMKRRLELYLPKFSIEGSYQLEEVLPKLGIRDVFTSNADLTGISNHSSIWLSEMVHKAVVEVDESGTQAAAATGTVITFKSARLGSQRIVFNRPFLMLIVENSKHILFFGKVTRP
uniref:Serpin domain-containing protein n=1 Tax=Capra hircus TaxID=9925 RepID=A0A8C2R3R0_CAPHI